MLKQFLFTLTALGLTLVPTLAQDTPTKTKKAAETAVEKAADTSKEAVKSVDTNAKKAVDTVADAPKETTKKATPATKKIVEPKKIEPKKSADGKTELKPGELSDSDKALVAHAEKEATKLTGTQKTKLLNLANTGDAEALRAIPGVGEVKAGAIIKARPLKSVPDLIMVEGVGEVTYDGIIKWTEGGMKVDDAAVADSPASKEKEAPVAKDKPAPKKPETAKKADMKKPK